MSSSSARHQRPSLIMRSRALASALSFLLVLTSALPPAALAAPQESFSRQGAENKNPQVEFVPGEILVRFRTEETAVSKEHGIAPLRTNNREIALEVEPFDGSELVEGLRVAHVEPEQTLDAVEALNRRADVVYAEPNFIWRSTATPNDPRFPEMYGLRNISAPSAWDITTGDRNVVVGVIDGGIDINHPDLQANIWRNPGETANNGVDDDGNGYIDDINGYDFHNNDASVYDSPTIDDHGTHVAGTIGATGNNALGVVGINWQVSIMALKVLGTESGSGSTSNIIRSYRYAKMMRERGINLRVLNNSYGGSGKSQAALDAILELNAAGILFVAAAGNDGTDNFSFPHFPSNYDAPNIIAVASTNISDNLSGFSNFGARVVSVGAPGSGILSTVPNGGYASFSGTSMATPHVTGAAALVLAANPNLSVQQLRGVLAFSGDVLPSLQSRTTTGRRLNVYRSILSAQENDTTAPDPASNFRIASQTGRNLTLAWTAPGDDGNAGTASDYDFFFTNSATGLRTHLPATTFALPAAAGSQQTATVSVPYRNFSGTVELRAYDNGGNFSSTTASVSISQNAGSDPYIVNLEAASGLSGGGTPLNLIGDDVFRENHALPFTFPYFGQNYNSLTVSSNGALYFSRIPRDVDDQSIGLDASSSAVALTGQTMIAGLWDDIRTDRGGDVFVVQPNADRVIFRWQAVTYDTPLSGGTTRGENPVNFEIELRRDGAIITRYGSGNTRLFPVVGISGGEPDAYVVASHTSENSTRNLTNAQTVTFAPRSVTPQNPIDENAFFVRQHYLDFLDREPETEGFNYWTGILQGCGTDRECLKRVRVEVSSRFFAELEFQRTGYYVMRLYKAAYGQFPSYGQFTSDRRLVQNNEASQRLFAAQFVGRAQFATAYPSSLTATGFVNQLYDRAGLTGFAAERAAHIAALNAGTKTRAEVLHETVQLPPFGERQPAYNAAWVRMQYFGYLRRDAEAQGEAYWTNVINVQSPNNYSAMICAFVNSSEYQLRFGSQRGQFSEADCSW